MAKKGNKERVHSLHWTLAWSASFPAFSPVLTLHERMEMG